MTKPLYLDLDKHFDRLLQIEEMLGEIGAIFEREILKTSPQSNSDTLSNINDYVNKVRIHGFFAYHLAQEGLSLMHILTASCAIVKKYGAGSTKKSDQVLQHIHEVDVLFHKASYDMEPYKSMNANEAIEVIAARITEKKKASEKGLL